MNKCIKYVSIFTLRRWDKMGQIVAERSAGQHRYFKEEDLKKYILNLDILKLSKRWNISQKPYLPPYLFYCQFSSIFQTRLHKLENELSKIPEFRETYSLITSTVGEIGNNSFDHNLGQWTDISGILFAYNLSRRQIVLSDRGQGVLKTLKRVKPSLKNDKEALRTAFTEIISGRSPESRGNGLKYVKEIIISNDFKLSFQSGLAKLQLKKGDTNLNIRITKKKVKGCLAIINF